MKRITGSLVVCSAAALFTAGTLLFADDSSADTPVDPYGTSGQGAATAAGGAALTIADFTFSALTVSPGATVSVSNVDGVQHTVSASNFDTGVVDGGGTASFVAPDEVGRYEFICNIHPSMQGALVVA